MTPTYTHDQLQASAHLWLWNSYPNLRYLSHANFNNLTTETANARIQMAKLKHKGLVRGILDYEFYYHGVLYMFDFKVGNDHLSDSQKECISMIESHGGKCYEIRSLEEFQKIITSIVENS